MSASGLIYAAIAVMWAAVLIPMWLRNHDTASENRSVERFGQAMRVLSRKEQAERDEARRRAAELQGTELQATERQGTERRATELQATERQATEQHERTAVPAARRPQPRVERPVRPARRQRTLAQRRARSLGVLAGLSLLLTLVAVAGPLPWWAPLPVVALLVAFVVHLRVQARQRLQRRRGPVARRTPASTSRPMAGESAEAPPAAPDEVPASGFVSGPSRAVVVETKGHAADADADADGAVASAAGLDDETWRPNPLPLPTYVTAPKAVRPIKVIDLTTPGAWSSGRLLDDGLSEEDLLAAEVADEELDALLAQEVTPPAADDAERRAVGD